MHEESVAAGDRAITVTDLLRSLNAEGSRHGESARVQIDHAACRAAPKQRVIVIQTSPYPRCNRIRPVVCRLCRKHVKHQNRLGFRSTRHIIDRLCETTAERTENRREGGRQNEPGGNVHYGNLPSRKRKRCLMDFPGRFRVSATLARFSG